MKIRPMIPVMLGILSLGLFSCGKEEAETVTEAISSETVTSVTSEEKTDCHVGVIYFSATGHTEAIALSIAEYYGTLAEEIIPAVPYTEEDLNYSDLSSRATAEQNDDAARPEMKNEIDISSYDTIYLGYSIWWGQAPKIMYTFTESEDFTGKTVIPFCTSASSPIGSSAVNLSKTAGGTWLEGRRFAIGDTKETVYAWIESLKLWKRPAGLF